MQTIIVNNLKELDCLVSKHVFNGEDLMEVDLRQLEWRLDYSTNPIANKVVRDYLADTGYNLEITYYDKIWEVSMVNDDFFILLISKNINFETVICLAALEYNGVTVEFNND